MEVTVGLKTTSVTDDIIDWPIPNKLLTALLQGYPIILTTTKSGSIICTKFKMWK